ncbi:hypothetical protein BJX70DRAFT_283776 [Aspergillus crustosus]
MMSALGLSFPFCLSTPYFPQGCPRSRSHKEGAHKEGAMDLVAPFLRLWTVPSYCVRLSSIRKERWVPLFLPNLPQIVPS